MYLVHMLAPSIACLVYSQSCVSIRSYTSLVLVAVELAPVNQTMINQDISYTPFLLAVPFTLKAEDAVVS